MTHRSPSRHLTVGACVLTFLFTFACSTTAQDDPPAAAVNLFTEAAGLQNKSEFDLAAEVWESFVDRYPDLELTKKAQHYLGVCYLQTGALEKAQAAFAKVVAGSSEENPFPQLEDALLNLGWCHFSLAQRDIEADSNFSKAATYLKRLIEDFPEGKYADQAWYFIAESMYLQGKIEDSIAPYQKVVTDHSDSSLHSNALYGLGVAFEDLDQADEALKIYSQFVGSYAEHSLANEVRMRVAELTLQNGLQLEAAGNAGEGLAQIADAEQTFKALATDENYDQRDLALFKQAYCAFKRDSLLESAQLYANVADQFPNSKYARASALSAGQFFYRSAQYDDAVIWLEKVGSGEDQESVEAAHWLCRIHLQRNEPQLAYLVANGMLTKSLPDSPFLILLKLDRADAAYEMPSRRDTAMDLYVELAEAHPDSSQAGQGWYYAAFAAFESDQYDKAVELATNYLAKYADQDLAADVLSVKGESELQLAEYEAAEATFKSLVENAVERQERETWWLRYALTLFLQQKSADTVAFLESKLDQFSNPAAKAEAYHLVGATQFREGEFDKATDSLQAGLGAKPDWRQADESMLLLARSQFRLGETKEAIKTASDMLASFGSSTRATEASYRLGEFQFADRDYPAAIASYDRVLESDDESFLPYALDGKAWSLFKQSQYEPAAQFFGQLIDRFSEHDLVAQARYGRAVCLNQTGAHQAALADVDAYLAGDVAGDEKANGLLERALAQIGLDELAGASTTLEELLEAFPEFDRNEQVLYELGWCYIDLGAPDKSVPAFTRITTEYPNGDNASEAHFHVGESHYRAKEYDPAIACYEKSLAASGNETVSENAAYKLGWSNFHLENYDVALETFKKQVGEHAEGDYSIDGQFMIGECFYRMNDFAEALAQYKRVWPILEASDSVNESYKASTLLHGAQSAGQVKEWDIAENYGTQFATTFQEAQEVPEAWLQVGRAQRGQDKLDEAIESLEKAALQSSDHVGAEARFLIGEIHFGKKEYEAAQRQYRRVILGFGGEDATSKVKTYQAMAAYEAARCAEVQIKDADGEQRTQFIADAKRYYQEVVDKFGDSPYAESAQKRLEALATLN